MDLEEGLLYVSKKYRVASHLCPCGCGSKVITPLGPTEWSFQEKKHLPSLYPSIGNWQLPCRSHYWIIDGEIEWSYDWTEEQIKAGAKKEEENRRQYFDDLNCKKHRFSFLSFIKKWFK